MQNCRSYRILANYGQTKKPHIQRHAAFFDQCFDYIGFVESPAAAGGVSIGAVSVPPVVAVEVAVDVVAVEVEVPSESPLLHEAAITATPKAKIAIFNVFFIFLLVIIV
jgi:hypothetical protein